MTTEQTAHLSRLKSHLRKGIELAEKAETPWELSRWRHDQRVIFLQTESEERIITHNRYFVESEDNPFGKNEKQWESNASFIAHACNSHKAHCEALLEEIEWLELVSGTYPITDSVFTDRLLSILAKYPNI